ncbi:MAG: ligase-associated DNA damage response endonuclease PdeM [Phycisphaerales bacterium]|jgi:DNA ligase-associated metallophosphoesterase
MTVSTGDISITLAGHELQLMPERALYWAARGLLLVADTHWGKCQAFRDAGSALPVGPLQADLERLRDAADRVNADRVVVLGDLVHGPASYAPGMDELIRQWRPTLGCELALVPGNHDRSITRPRGRAMLEGWGVNVLPPRVELDGLALTHEPPIVAREYTLCGHVHPTVRLRGRGERVKLPCFWLDVEYHALVLPAFSSFVDGAPVRAGQDDARWATAGSRVWAV